MPLFRLLACLSLVAISLAAEPISPPVTRTPEQMLAELRKYYPESRIHDPDTQRQGFLVHPDFEVTLFASSPWVINPIAMAWDSRHRLWVINSPMYPQILPGQRPMDFISVLEDTDQDGRADRCTLFYDRLYVPTGLALGDGGVYVANQPDLLFLRDTDGDGRADTRRILLSGFGTEDNHHAISAFRWGPGGWLYFMSGVFLHTQVETPHGLVRVQDGATFQLKPRVLKLDTYNVGTATNPWGLAFNEWGQSFLTEGPQGGIWHLNPGHIRTKPAERTPDTLAPKACGNEFLDSDHFAPPYRGTMALNAFKNKTVNLYQFSDSGAGFATRELQPLLLQSNEPYFRPVDVKLGPDGALYVADFFQEIIGHMQYEFRDNRRDHLNGRIWRITQKGRAPLPRLDLEKQPTHKLIQVLKSPNGFERDQCRRLLYERAPSEPGISQVLLDFARGLDRSDPRWPHHQLEALWALQTIDQPAPELLRQVLASPEPNARAAACVVLRDWLPHLPDAGELLAERAKDPSPRVRMEALVTLSYLPRHPLTLASVAAVSDQPMDRSLAYAFRHAVRSLREEWEPMLKAGTLRLGSPRRLAALLTAGGGSQGTVATLLTMLRTGQIQPEARSAVLDLIAEVATDLELPRLLDAAAYSDPAATRLDGWHVAGLFKYDPQRPLAEQALPFEGKRIDPAAELTNEAGGAVRWRPAAGKGPFDLNKLFSRTDRKFAYALASLAAASPTEATLEVASDDAVEVFLNGQKIHSNPVARSLGEGIDRVPVRLERGTHQLLVKVGNRTGGFGFDVRVLGLAAKGYDQKLHRDVLAALGRAAEAGRPVPGSLPVASLRQLLDGPLAAEARSLVLASRHAEHASLLLSIAAAGDADTVAALRALAECPLSPSQRDEAVSLALKLANESERADVAIAAAGLLAAKRSPAALSAAKRLLGNPPAPSADFAPLLAGFVGRKGGPEELAAALNGAQLNPDAARLALRWLNESGLQPAELVSLLTKAAGSSSLAKDLAKIPLAELLNEVKSKGDPARGELVFRRKDLACLTCHAVAGGGASIGPDLEGLGTSSPLDYLAEAVLLPNKAVREGYGGVTLLTDQGKLITGIPVKKTPEAWLVKDAAARKVVTISAASIEETKDAGSIMPANLVDQMTRQEFLDLVRFIAELGKPGPYATPNLPVVRSWKVLAPQGQAQPSPNGLPPKATANWLACYSAVDGNLPLAELPKSASGIVTLSTVIDVTQPGKMLLKLNDVTGLAVWVDDASMSPAKELAVDLRSGRRRVVLQVDTRRRGPAPLRLELAEVPGSAGRGQVVKYEW